MPLNNLTVRSARVSQGQPYSSNLLGLSAGTEVEATNALAPGFVVRNGRLEADQGSPPAWSAVTVQVVERNPQTGERRVSNIKMQVVSPGGDPLALSPLTYPEGFLWDQAKYPVSVYPIANGRYGVGAAPRDLVSASIWAGPAYYVDAAAANSAGTGLTPATAVKSIAVALDRLNKSAAAGGRVFIKAGAYDRTMDMVDSAASNGLGGIVPEKNVAFIGYGGVVEIGPFQLLNFTPDSGAYIAARSAVSRVIDLVNRDEFGDYIEIGKRADAATVNAENGWFQDGGNIRIRRPDGAAVNNANTRVFLAANNAQLGSGNVDAYYEGLSFQAGAGVCFRSFAASTGNIVFNRVKCSGPTNAAINAVAIDNRTGLFAAFNCDASKGTADGWNFHGTTGQLHVLLVDTRGDDNGRTGATSCNGLTLHENVRAIVVTSRFRRGAGGTVRNIGSSQMWALATTSQDDRGDVAFGGAITPTQYQFDDTAKAWLYDCSALGGNCSLRVSSTASVVARNFNYDGTIEGAGSIVLQ